MELAGKTVLLTGATGGLGRAMAEALAERGATLVLSSRKPQELDELALGLPGEGHRRIVSDLAVPGAAEALIAEAGDGRRAGRQRRPRRQRRASTTSPPRRSSASSGSTSRRRCARPARSSRRCVSEAPATWSSSRRSRARRRPRRPRSTRRPRRGCGASRSRCARTWPRDGVGVSIVCPGFVAEAGMFARLRAQAADEPRARRRRRRWPRRPSRRSSATGPRSTSRRCASACWRTSPVAARTSRRGSRAAPADAGPIGT